MLVPVAPAPGRPTRPVPYPFLETALVVAFAAADTVEGDVIPLASLPEISHDDGYLVLPLRARAELFTAFARGTVGRVAQWFDDALVVRAEVACLRAPRLRVTASWRVRDVLARERGRTVAMGGLGDPVRVVNQLPFVSGLAPGGLLDRAGAEAVTTRDVYVGVSRMGIADLGLGADAVESTFVWSERDVAGAHVRVALAASEDDSAHALLGALTLAGTIR